VRRRELYRWPQRNVEEERRGREELFEHFKETEAKRHARGTDGQKKNLTSKRHPNLQFYCKLRD